MKLYHQLSAVAMLLLLAPAQSVQGRDFASRWALQPVLGAEISTGDFGDATKNGFQWGVKLRRNVHPYYATEAAWLYTKHNLQNSTGDLSLSRLTWDHIVYLRHAKVKPFIAVGLGLYQIGSIPAIDTDKRDREFGINVGAGVEFLTSERNSLVLNFIRFHMTGKARKMDRQRATVITTGIGLNFYLH
jgi:hypothetical protein